MEHKNNNRENLLHDLPDYISGELSDNKVITEIDELINNDPSFKSEFESMKSALSFVSTAELSSPDEVYFANLQSRVLSKTSAKESVPFYSKLISYWKYLVPAVTVCIVILVYSSSMNNNTVVVPVKDNVSKTETKNNISQTESPKNETASVTGNNEELEDLYYSTDEETSYENSEDSSNDLSNFLPPVLKHKIIYRSQPSENSQNALLEDVTQQQINLFNNETDDGSYEDDFRSLNPDEQKQILEELKKSKL